MSDGDSSSSYDAPSMTEVYSGLEAANRIMEDYMRAETDGKPYAPHDKSYEDRVKERTALMERPPEMIYSSLEATLGSIRANYSSNTSTNHSLPSYSSNLGYVNQ